MRFWLAVSVTLILFAIPALAQQPPTLSPEITLRFQLGQALQAEARAEALQVAQSDAARAKAAWWLSYVQGLRCAPAGRK